MKKNKAFTLVELLIVMAILMTLTVMAVGIINPIALVNRGKDAQRKKDLNRIKVAFEEYFNDKGYYPGEDLVEEFMDKDNCKKNIEDFSYLKPWPCDPNGEPYLTFAEIGNKFRVVTNLENKEDKDIPLGWYEREDFFLMGKTKEDVNYGVSSSNILWYDELPISPLCNTKQCNEIQQGGGCGHSPSCSGKSGNCYYWTDGKCDSVCRVPPCYFCPR